MLGLRSVGASHTEANDRFRTANLCGYDYTYTHTYDRYKCHICVCVVYVRACVRA